ncbi:MAG: hypothetical protein JO127_12345 [Caulobacteraceae bacterium]|nr:hypothetical protein [Caulobacteraceae bacterium]
MSAGEGLLAGDPKSRLMAAAIIGAGAAVCLWLNLPGHLSYDSVVQLAEGRAAVYGGHHPPVMSWLLGVLDALHPGAVLFVVLDTLLIFGALTAFVLLGRRFSRLAVVLAAFFMAIPQLAIYPAIVWKDVLFAGSATAGFACLAWAARRAKAKGGGYWLLLGAGLSLLTLAALARQNGAVALPFAAAAVGWIASDSAGGDLGRGWRHGLGFLAGAVALAVAGSAALSTRVQTPAPIEDEWESLQVYDIAGALARAPGLGLGVLHAKAPRIEALLRDAGARLYSPVRIDPLAPVVEQVDAGGEAAGLIGAQWRGLALRHPLLYLRVRAQAFRWVFLTPRPKACVAIYTGVDGPAQEMIAAGLSPRKTIRDDALADYAFAFATTPVYSHLAFAAGGVLLLVLLVRRRRPEDVAVAAMLGAAVAFAGSFAVISIACDYRYLYDLDVAVIAAALYWTASLGPGAWGFPKLRRRG